MRRAILTPGPIVNLLTRNIGCVCKMKDDNFEHCKGIRDELERYYNGDVYKCPICGELGEMHEEENADGDIVYVMECGCRTEDEPEQLSLYDYLSDVYDIVYYVGSNKDVRGVRLMVACGGPNIFIDTFDREIQLYWWNESAKCSLDYDIANEITSLFEEIYNC